MDRSTAGHAPDAGDIPLSTISASYDKLQRHSTGNGRSSATVQPEIVDWATGYDERRYRNTPATLVRSEEETGYHSVELKPAAAAVASVPHDNHDLQRRQNNGGHSVLELDSETHHGAYAYENQVFTSEI